MLRACLVLGRSKSVGASAGAMQRVGAVLLVREPPGACRVRLSRSRSTQLERSAASRAQTRSSGREPRPRCGLKRRDAASRETSTLLDRLWDVLDSLDQHLLRIFWRTSAARCKWRTSSRSRFNVRQRVAPPAHKCRSACTRHQTQTSTRCASGCAAAGVLGSRRLAGHRTATGDTSRMHLAAIPLGLQARILEPNVFVRVACDATLGDDRACLLRAHTASTHFGMSP